MSPPYPQKSAKDLKIICERRYLNGQQVMKRCSTSVTIREIKIDITTRYHTASRTAKIFKRFKKVDCTKLLPGYETTETLIADGNAKWY